MKIQSFFDRVTLTLTYVVWDEATKDAAVIDPVLDYDQGASAYSYQSILKVMNYIKEES